MIPIAVITLTILYPALALEGPRRGPWSAVELLGSGSAPATRGSHCEREVRVLLVLAQVEGHGERARLAGREPPLLFDLGQAGGGPHCGGNLDCHPPAAGETTHFPFLRYAAQQSRH
jgi:hypothetical protein